jgi:3-hydroxyisobutyrate dehydrogenase
MPDEFRPPERVGFIGLGNMGAPMARRICEAGYTLRVMDASPEAVERFRSRVDCSAETTPAALGQACRVVITMLPDGHAVRQVALEDGGLASRLAPGAVMIDMSSSAPTGTRELAAELSRSGIVLIDAPVSGGVARAQEGKLAIMAGGDPAALARCGGLFAALGQVFATGPSGSGHAMKALNNYLSAIALGAAGEAIIAGERFGIDPATMIRILNSSTGRNTATEQKFPAFVLPRTFNSGFALGLMAKDLRIALGLARETGAPAMLLESCARLWERAEQQLGFGADNTEVVRYLESLPAGGASG